MQWGAFRAQPIETVEYNRRGGHLGVMGDIKEHVRINPKIETKL